MKHICDEKGCRLVSDEEYEKILELENKSNEKENKEKKQK